MANDLAIRYQALSIKDRVSILAGISKLMLQTCSGDAPSVEDMQKASEASGHTELFLDCYEAQILGQEWRNPALSEGYIIRWKSVEYEDVVTDSCPFKKRVYKEEGNGLEVQTKEQAIANCDFLNKWYPERIYWHFWVSQSILDNAENEGLQPVGTVAHHLFVALSQAHQ